MNYIILYSIGVLFIGSDGITLGISYTPIPPKRFSIQRNGRFGIVIEWSK